MPYRITNEDQPECDTPLRSSIHAKRKDHDFFIDTTAQEENTAPDIVESVLKVPLRRPDNTKYPTENVSQGPSMGLLIHF